MESLPNEVRTAAQQEQFLEVISRDEAERRFHAHLRLAPVGIERVSLADALGRVLAASIIADIDVPGFDRSNVDGFAVHAADTFGAMDESPRELRLNAEVLAPGTVPTLAVLPGTATPIATGGMVPRGADAVVMVEYTDVVTTEESPETRIQVTRAVAAGEQISFTGTDIARGETVLRAGQLLTSREIGMLAAIGRDQVDVYRKPRVAVFSTGNEIVPPGSPRPPGGVYDSNAAIVSAAVIELGGEAVCLGSFPDDEARLSEAFERALASDVDAVILSGGTSKGAGDISYRVVSRLRNPGIVAHGVALKPGKPICLAVTDGRPVVILPGFPTSAIFTFHEFVAPVLRAFAGRAQHRAATVTATLPVRVNSDRGRTEYLLVGLVHGEQGLAAYPMGKGSGSVTTFSTADGFLIIDQQTEIVPEGSTVSVQLLGHGLEPADLVVIGSHCVGLDYLLEELQQRGFRVRLLNVGSSGGLAAAKRGECDLAGIHLMNPETGEYNTPFLTQELELIPGYRRLQGLVFRSGDTRFEGKSITDAITAALADPDCVMVNRNAGSGTRILIDRLLQGKLPPGYAVQAKSHNAVATAVEQQRADWGVAIDTVARQYGLGFIPLQEEHYDFVIPKTRRERPAVQAFRQLLSESAVRSHLQELGFHL